MKSMLLSLGVITTLLPCLHAQGLPPFLGDYLEPTSAMAREHVHHASAQGVVQRDDGTPVVGATVLVLAYRPFFWALPLGSMRTDEQGAYRFEDISGIGNTALWVVSPEGEPFRTKTHPLTLVSGRSSTLRPIILPRVVGRPDFVTTFRGKLLAGDGTPIVGALVRLIAAKESFDPTCYAFTGGDGSFALPLRSGHVERAQVFFGNAKIEIEHKDGVETLQQDGLNWRLDLTGERTLQSDQFVMVDASAEGGQDVELAWSLGHLFTPCVGGKAPSRKRDNIVGSVRVRSAAVGQMPEVTYPPDSTKKAPAGDQKAELTVVDDTGAALAGAIVDLCEEGRRFSERTIQTLRTDQDGRLLLLGRKADARVLYVYAAGHDPVRARWLTEQPLEVRLPRRTGKLHLSVDDDESTIYVRKAGTFDYAAMVYPLRGNVDIDLAPGDYEVTRYRNGPVVAAMGVTVAAGGVTPLELNADLRPAIEVQLPELAPDSGWWVYGSRSAVGGMVAKRMIYTTRDGPTYKRELVAEVDQPESGRTFHVRLPTSGRYTVLAGHEELDGRAFREVRTRLGDKYVLTLPALDGKLKATMAAFPPGWESGMMDGVAGPRLCLEPEADTAFGFLVSLPEPKEFTLPAVPAGTFSLQHHLYKTGFLRSSDGTWGGTAVSVTRGAVADAGTLQRGPDGELVLHLVAASGAVLDGSLEVRDRMFESWQAVLDENTTLEFASDPIPQPTAAWLVDGEARLTRIRKGRVQFVLSLTDGRTVFFARDVDPGTPLTVKLEML